MSPSTSPTVVQCGASRSAPVASPTVNNAADLERFRQLADEQLIRFDAELKPAALEVLYERHQVLAFSLAVRIVGSPDRAQAIVQDAFLNLWRDAGRYDPTRGSVRTWLMSMVHQRGIDSVRTLSTRERMQAAAASRARPSTEIDLSSGQADIRETQAIQTAVRTLSEDERLIIELAYFDGWTQGEIADMLKLSLDTVKSRARDGLLKLRDALLSQLEAPP
jgi:RNA polymerase sigma-70 factor (ECF subfamily)